MMVVDASAVLEVLLNTAAAPQVADLLFAEQESLHAPHLIDLEIVQVLRRYNRAGSIDGSRGQQALADFGDIPITRYPHDLLLPRIWALRSNLTAYDAAYVALAELLDAPLVTRDSALAKAPGHSAQIRVIN